MPNTLHNNNTLNLYEKFCFLFTNNLSFSIDKIGFMQKIKKSWKQTILLLANI